MAKDKAVQIAPGVTTEQEGDTLVIRLDMSREGRPSKSGKRITVATTGGLRALDDTHELNLTLARRPD